MQAPDKFIMCGSLDNKFNNKAKVLSATIPGISPGGRGGTMIFSYIRRLGSFFWFKILNFIIFWGFQKMNIFWGIKILWIFFGVITKLDYI